MSLSISNRCTVTRVRIGARLHDLDIPDVIAPWDLLIMPFELVGDLLMEVCWPRPKGRRIVALFPAGQDPDLPMKVALRAAIRSRRERRNVMDLSWAISGLTDVSRHRSLPRYPLVVRISRNGGEPELVVHVDDVGAWHQLLGDFSRHGILRLLGSYGRGLRNLEEAKAA
ncbi:hypothetical protein D3C71_258800 [compost metagenome]